MSVAVAHMPQILKEERYRVQSEVSNNLLEALLASCQKPLRNDPLPGYGRELVPYFGTTEDKPVAQSRRSRSNTTSPQRNSRKAAAIAAAMVAAAKKSSAKSATDKSTVQKTPAQVEETRAARMAALMNSWAGPGFCIAPTPEKLPAPTFALLG